MIISAACCAMLLTACGKGQGNDSGADTLVSVATSDSISAAYGSMAGGYIGGELKNYAMYMGQEYDRAEFMKGVQAVMSHQHPDAYIAGLSTGLRIHQDVKEMEKQGVQVDRAVLLKALKAAIMADSLNDSVTRRASETYQTLMTAVQNAAREREELRKAGSPEAVKNVKTAEAYINKLRKDNPNIQQTQSGLYYSFEKMGQSGALPKATDRLIVDYVGKHIDGKVFDESKGAMMQPAQMIPGFKEALMMMTPGATATFYIPGNLAYGANGQPQAGIGPMEMLVFDVTLVANDSQTPAEAEPAK